MESSKNADGTAVAVPNHTIVDGNPLSVLIDGDSFSGQPPQNVKVPLFNFSKSGMIADFNSCESILKRAEQYYTLPLNQLQLQKPLEQLYSESASTKPYGQWLPNVPRPGDVAGCFNKKGERER